MQKTPHQQLLLDRAYASESNPNALTTAKLSKDSGLTYKQVQGWFYRQRVKTKEELRRQQSRLIHEPQSKSSSCSESESKLRQSNEPLEAANLLDQIASHVDSFRVKVEERMQATNEKQDKKVRTSKRLRHESSSEPGLRSDSGPCNEPLAELDRGGDSDGGVKNKMIDVLINKNKSDEAKCESIIEEFMRLEKSIEDRKKLIDDIKKVG